jgi:hypothetical protein
MESIAQITSAAFALLAALLWLRAARIKTPSQFRVRVTVTHIQNSENPDGSQITAEGHGTIAQD